MGDAGGIASALARLVRMKQIDSVDWVKAKQLVKSLANSCSVIQPSDSLRATSVELLERYDLPAADAFQLGSATRCLRCQGTVIPEETLPELSLFLLFIPLNRRIPPTRF